MALVNADDQWLPPLAPIRTTPSSACTHASHKDTYHTIGEHPFSHHPIDTNDHPQAAVASASSPPFSLKPDCPNSSRPSDSTCCSCTHLLTNCFSCVRPHRTSSSPRCPHHRCTTTCLHRKRFIALRSLAFLFPAAGRMQFLYSSIPTAKAQLSGTFPRTPSGKFEQYISPRTPSATALTSQLSGKFSHFSSPRTPASNKVQHFSGAIPSPRTPYGPSVATSPASARRKKPSFTLIMPPGMMDKNKAFEQIIDEPTSPHVTCIGRVRRQTHCKMLLHSDTVDHRNQRCQDAKARRKGTTISRKKNQSFTDPTHTHESNSAHGGNIQMVTEQSNIVLEACTQKFGKEKLLNLHKIQGHQNETSHAYINVLFEANTAQSPESATRSDVDGVHVVSHKCFNEDHALRKTSGEPLENVQRETGIETECKPATSREIQVQQTSSSCMQAELLVDDDDGGGGGAETHLQGQRCRLLMRSNGSRRFSEAERVSLASCVKE